MKKYFKSKLIWTSLIWASLLLLFSFLFKDTAFGEYVPFVVLFSYSFFFALFYKKEKRQVRCQKVTKD